MPLRFVPDLQSFSAALGARSFSDLNRQLLRLRFALIARAGVELPPELGGRDGPAKKPALAEDVARAAAGLCEVLNLPLGFNAFNHHHQVKLAGDFQDLRDYRCGDRVGSDGGCENAVDFDGVDGQVVQIGERGVAGAEVVDIDGMAE